MEPTETNAAPWVRAHNGWFTCRLNVSYYTEKIRQWKRADAWLRWTSVFLSSGGVAGAVTLSDAAAWPVAIALLSSAVGAFALVSRYSEQIQGAAALLPQYTAAEGVFRELYYRGDVADEKQVIAAWKTLDRIMIAEAEMMPAHDRKALDRAEVHVRGQRLGELASAVPAPAA